MKKPWLRVARLAADLRRALWLAPRGCGKPVPLEAWEREYRTGAWDYLTGVGELARYMTIAGYAIHSSPPPDILDVGCGSGHLLRRLPAAGFRSYLGVDFSTEAIACAHRMQVPGAQFVQGDFEVWSPSQPVDVIIFNESLYNSRRPAELVARYAGHLRAEGRIIVSMFKASGDGFIWRRLNAMLQRVDGVEIVHDDGRRWQVALFARRPA